MWCAEGFSCPKEVDTFDIALGGMIPMPTDQVAFVGIGLLFDRVIEDEHGVILFDLS